MRKLGIFLGYPPETKLKNQGISRLLALIISRSLKISSTELQIVIACPLWSYADVRDLLFDHEVDIKSIEFIMTTKKPLLLRLISFSRFFSKIKRPKRKLKNHISNLVFKLTIKYVALSETSKIIFYSAVFLILASLFLYFLYLKIFYFVMAFAVLSFLMGILYFIKKLFKKIPLDIREAIYNPLSTFRRYKPAYEVYDEIRRSELLRLIKTVNKRKDLNEWFIPAPFWPEVKHLVGRKIIAVPDVVYLEFPTLFATEVYSNGFKTLKKTLECGQQFICYSQHVKTSHLVYGCGISHEKINVISHGKDKPIVFLEKHMNAASFNFRQQALALLKEHQRKFFKGDYLRDFDFTNIQYIFYSSQLRVHKNILNLIKAFDFLINVRGLRIKLILTCDVSHESEVLNYIIENQLQDDVISFFDVSSPTLLALNALASLSVNPTLFEGGFPFTFNEAYIVGTPSIMSKIPVVLEHINDEKLKDIMLFDPYNFMNIAEKIVWGLDNKELLFELQKPLFESFPSWENVANQYVKAILNI